MIPEWWIDLNGEWFKAERVVKRAPMTHLDPGEGMEWVEFDNGRVVGCMTGTLDPIQFEADGEQVFAPEITVAELNEALQEMTGRVM